ncbi:MAG: hypothetical protein GTO42_02380 [Candidatus Latescibacteria bacterium]|nr:hypothetical protein [Candidatus Latescibacterota bacterium]NIO00983.1 hypothetical protein [Candidatus Latescibacterota bacterium]NIO27382.1 hypothetical protein [Candidatus Latescibacterota bacterium]NIO54904.1 hypothetical protein [Candidatus Latescibacterota bacterium]NIT00993.1 hypothetical protein [Candidatus Latescibacterota bacterium]
MKWVLLLMIVGLMPMSVGCLAVDSLEMHIEYQGEDKPANVTIVYRDITSVEESIEAVKKDFESLIKDFEGDEYLLDRSEEGFFIKKRELFIEEGKIVARSHGIVKDLDEVHSIWVKNGELILLFEEDEDFVLVESNGEVFKTPKNTLIVWPENSTKLYFKQRVRERCEPCEKNRPLMVKMLEGYLEQKKHK